MCTILVSLEMSIRGIEVQDAAIDIYLSGMPQSAASLTVRLGCDQNQPVDKSDNRNTWCDGKVTLDGVIVHDGRFKTEKGVGVGSSIRSFLDAYSVNLQTGSREVGGEEDVLAIVKEIGTTFFFDVRSSELPQGWKENPSLVPEKTKVRLIWVWGLNR